MDGCSIRRVFGALLAIAACFGSVASGSAAAAGELPAGCSEASMYVVAHEDDSLLFQSPALLADIEDGDCVRSVFLTAGDAGADQSYWITREEGVEAAYAQMAGSPDSWTVSTLAANGHSIRLETLTGHPQVSLVFMRLPDGNPDGTGFLRSGEQSLERLWDSRNPSGDLEPPISSIAAVDDSTSYGYEDLIGTLGSVISDLQPQRIATQNFRGSFQHSPDHSDHVATAYFTEAAQRGYSAPHQLIGYEAYEVSGLEANVSGAPLGAKSAAFYTYGQHDSRACAGPDGCAGTAYESWLARQYVADVETTGVTANAGPAQSVATGATVTLDGSASADSNGKALSYAWTQSAGPAVTLSNPAAAKPTFTAPAQAASLAFSLVVSNGSQQSQPATTEVTVKAPSPPASENVAPLATASASSQATGQGAAKAIDGVISGYPKESGAEWATNGGKANSTLTLKWSRSYLLDRVVLYDRPNANDQITAGKLTFADGQSVSFGALPNAGTPGLTVTFPAHATTSLKLTVTTVSSTTQNVGLSELQAFGVAGS